MENLILFIVLVGIGYSIGTIAEKRHYKSIEEREEKFLHLPAVTMRNILEPDATVEKATLVTCNSVISIDYFKRILAGLRNIFGGQVSAYETLVDRARREAVLRMKADVSQADMIMNVRIETSAIGSNANRRKSIGSIEALAYGTAVTLKKI